jgi:hypothetical protein
MGWWTLDRQRHAFNRLLSGGLSDYGAAGLVSRWVNVESIESGPFSVNPSSGAFGIAQWLGSRLPPIRGNTDFDAQLDYVLSELNSSEARAGDILRNAANVNEGAIGATVYERAEGYNGTTDNFTGRTANGIAAVLAAAGNSDVATGNGNDGTYQPSENQSDFDFQGVGIGSNAPLLIAAGLLGFFLLRRFEII